MAQKGVRVTAPASTKTEPLPPEDLSAESLDEWERVVGLLRQRGVLDALDQAGLRDYITCWSRLLECEEDISTRGVLVIGERGIKIKNPACQIARVYRDSLLAWTKEFGFSVASRERLAMPREQARKTNKWDNVD
jgi:P27 family predicted phage terminase small subunit